MNKTPGCLMLACEILWDCFPDGNRFGGATCNVAYFLNRLGLKPLLIASVGRDALGDEALRLIKDEWGCDTRWIQRLDQIPTGRVKVAIGPEGDATYDVLAPVAWDFVEIPDEAIAGYRVPLMYPSVGLRSAFNRDRIRRVLADYPGLKCFDANLRPPHNSVEIVMEFARRADFVKVNRTELKVLASAAGSSATGDEDRLVDLARSLDVDTLCVTRADEPALMLHRGAIHYGRSHPTEVRDTVGAGDAFMASMIASLTRSDFEASTALSQASQLGSWVASKAGAQPACDGSEPAALKPPDER